MTNFAKTCFLVYSRHHLSSCHIISSLENCDLQNCEEDFEMPYNPEDPLQRSKAVYGDSASIKPLPFFRKFNLPPAPDEIPVNPGIIAESCGGKIISGAAIGELLKC
jgi:hypothetical protein